MKKLYLFLQHKQLFKFILNVLIIAMSSVVYAKDTNLIQKKLPKNQLKRTIELDYFTKAPLTIDGDVTQYPIIGIDLSQIEEGQRDTYKYHLIPTKETLKLNKAAAKREREALAEAGKRLALVCTTITHCALKYNEILTRKERVGVNYSGISSYPNGMNDGVVAWVNRPIKGTVLFIKSNLPSVKKDYPIKTWYVNLEALKKREQGFNPEDYPVYTTEEAEAEQLRKKKYIQTISLDKGNKLTVIGKTKEKDGLARIDWFVKVNNIEKKLTFMEEPVLELKDMTDISDYVLWVGDLDGDNQPDLIINNDGGWGELEYKLFLSTDIKPNKPWKPAATFDWWSGNPHC